jgi:hypothetical protein
MFFAFGASSLSFDLEPRPKPKSPKERGANGSELRAPGDDRQWAATDQRRSAPAGSFLNATFGVEHIAGPEGHV